jgi:hypothetical protein
VLLFSGFGVCLTSDKDFLNECLKSLKYFLNRYMSDKFQEQDGPKVFEQIKDAV